VAGGTGDAIVPGEKIPKDAGQHRAENCVNGDKMRVDHSGADSFCDGGATERADEVGNCCQDDRLAGSENFRGNDGRNGICRVVKSIGVRKDEDDYQDDDEKK
jgi:hypothetical protein